MAITLQYDESGLSYTQRFQTLAVRGMREPDKLTKVGITHRLLDGTIVEQIRGFRKEITITFRPPFSPVQTRFLEDWFSADAKRLFYGFYISEGITDKELVSQWLYDCEYGRTFDVPFFDSTVYTVWEDGVTTGDDMYIKNNVLMDQDATLDSPEVFTTNSGKLAVMEDGFEWPVFDPLLYDFFVLVCASNLAPAVYPESHTVDGDGNMVISTFPGSGYIPAADGQLYANFGIQPRIKLI